MVRPRTGEFHVGREWYCDGQFRARSYTLKAQNGPFQSRESEHTHAKRLSFCIFYFAKSIPLHVVLCKFFSSDTAAVGTGEKYPAMSEEEIEEWLSHIPVFAVTDSKGQGVVLRPDNDTSVFYFFMSPQMANATLQTLKGANEDMDLQISAMSLGKIWFKILNAGDDAAVKVCAISFRNIYTLCVQRSIE